MFRTSIKKNPMFPNEMVSDQSVINELQHQNQILRERLSHA